ncbi:hypothetical protein Tco_1005136 [Tanacetum coccineum]|uniref:Uncharacterized protein n=1 Tax=Tanacetum coccineum TaxID=301880 RepID=A0ABQ5FEG9_9ASTR
MHSIWKTIVELHAMLKLTEKGLLKKAATLVVLAIRGGNIQKYKNKLRGAKGSDKGKSKLAYAPKPKIPPPHKKDNPTKDSICHHCKEGLRGSRKMKHGPLNMYVGNGMRAAVKEIGSFDFVLPSGLIIVLDNFHYAPTITRGVVSLSRLVDNNYVHTFTNYGISVSKDYVLYFNDIPSDGYALESTVCILNMVPTKKVDKTPYDIWHGKACKLSYLRVWGCEALSKMFVAQNAELFENSITLQEVSGSNVDLEIIQEENIHNLLKILAGNGYSLKDKNQVKMDKTEHGNGKSVKSQSQPKSQKSKTKPISKKYLMGQPALI